MTQNEHINSEVEVEAEDDDESYVTYDIATYPSDLTLSGIYEQWNAQEILIPDYQREFVWSQKQASLLIESFLLGLPIPPVFLYIDEENRYVVIDGQQRITSLIYFFDGYFGDQDANSKKIVFKLTGLSPKSPFLSKTFAELQDNEQRKLRGAVLRAVNIRQLSPKGSPTAAYHIFERLNTGGTPLKPQEIRNCVYRGPVVDRLRSLNRNVEWRKILGKEYVDKHQKDVELILRLFALFEGLANYQRPMKDFLSTSMKRNLNFESPTATQFEGMFPQVARQITEELGTKPFSRRGPVNSALLESVFVSLLRGQPSGGETLHVRFEHLKVNEDFLRTISQSTANEEVVRSRHSIAFKVLTG